MSDTDENIVPFETPKGKIRALASALLERWQWARQAGITFEGKRDLYEALGYTRELSIAQYV